MGTGVMTPPTPSSVGVKRPVGGIFLSAAKESDHSSGPKTSSQKGSYIKRASSQSPPPLSSWNQVHITGLYFVFISKDYR